MKCIICDAATQYYFSKTYTEAPFDQFMAGIGKVTYNRCVRCGFVLSKTHSELPEKEWDDLNQRFHHYIENQYNDKKGNQPPYAEQAMLLLLLGKNNIISLDSMVDYAAGYGTLSNLLKRYCKIQLPIYDPYIKDSDPSKYIDAKNLGIYRTVISSAMFEHVLRREDLNQVNKLVDPAGCLILHTVICENVPADPDWFYLRPPVHTAFHTNRSMSILMEQWGYKSSIYSPQAKSWVLLKENEEVVKDAVESINHELQTNWLFCKNGFVDYWKGF